MHSANSTDPIKPQQPVIKDTLAYNIQTTYARLAAMISDTTIPAAAFYKAPVTKQDFWCLNTLTASLLMMPLLPCQIQ